MGLVERFVGAALHQRLFVLLCVAAVVATGIVAYRELPVEAFPDLTNNQVVVVTEAPGLASTEVEQRVTYPIETALMGVPGADQVRSISKFELSIITVVFDDSVPVYFARQLVNERLLEARARIPAGLDPTLGPVAYEEERSRQLRNDPFPQGPLQDEQGQIKPDQAPQIPDRDGSVENRGKICRSG